MNSNTKEVTIPDIIGADGLFKDGDWIESKDQDQNGGVRLIQLADIGDGQYQDRSAKFLTFQRSKELKCTYIKTGDILLSRMPDPLGRACIFPGDKRPCVVAVDICIIRPDSSIVDNKWLSYAINSPNFRSDISSYASGSTRKRISRSNLGKIHFRLPSLSEQQRIAANLDKAGELRLKRRRAIQRLEDLLQSAFLEMFGDPINSPYPIMDLDNVCAMITDGTHVTPSYIDSGIPFLRVTDIQSDVIDWEKAKRIPPKEYNQLIKRCRPLRGDVLYSKNGTIGIPRLVDWDDEFFIFVSLALLRPKPELILGSYLESFLTSPFALQQAKNHSKTGTVTNLHLIEIKKIRLPVPPLDIQRNWIFIKSSIKDERNRLTKSAQILDNLFYSIQQRAFQGEL